MNGLETRMAAGNLFMSHRSKSGVMIIFAVAVLACVLPGVGQTQPTFVPAPEQHTPDPGIASAGGQLPDQQSTGSISGTVVDESGAVVAGARVKLTREGQSPNQEALSGDDGQFSFANLAPGPFQLTITSPDLATQTSSGILHPGEGTSSRRSRWPSLPMSQRWGRTHTNRSGARRDQD